MILTVTLNPAVDVTYRVPALRAGDTHRVSAVTRQAGGKGVNVARVLHALGVPVVATGLAGAGFDLDGLPAEFVTTAAPARHTLVVTDGRDATGFWEPGGPVTAPEWSAFRDRYAALAAAASVVVLSGSLPAGLPERAYADLVDAARRAGADTILDTSGPALALGAAARPDVVKPNRTELADLGSVDPATAVVASHGPEGLHARTPAGAYHARPPHPVPGNPTGAGDACVAALARGLAAGTPWPDLLADAVALSAAAVGSPVAGGFDPDLYQRLRPAVTVEPRPWTVS